jgi:hypothetical protein
MKQVKIFMGHPVNVENELNRWVDEHPSVVLGTVLQSSCGGDMIAITIFFHIA